MIIYQDHLVRVSYWVIYQIFGNTKLKLVERRASFYWKNDSNTGQYLYYFLFTSLLYFWETLPICDMFIISNSMA